MGIRPDPHEPDLWHIDCRPDGYQGRRLRETFTGTKEAAEDYYRALMRQPSDQPKLAKAPTIKAIWPDYLNYCRANRAKTTVDDLIVCWNAHLSDSFGHLQPKMLNRQIIESYKNKRLAEKKWGKSGQAPPKPRSITKELHYLSGMIAWAAKNDLCNPLPFKIEGFPSKMTQAPRARPLRPEQVTALLAMLDRRYHLAILLMADAGLRATEALTMRGEDVDLAREILYVTGKGGKERIVPVTTVRLKEELKRHAGQRGYLTINPRTGEPYLSLKKTLATAAKKAGIEQRVYQHLLRHTFGVVATMADMSQKSIQLIMGHASPETTGIYQVMAADFLKTQAAKLGNMLDCPHGNMDNQDNSAK